MKLHLMLILGVLFVSSLGSSALAQTKTREQLIDEIAAKRNELVQLEQQFLGVPETDRSAFADLLAEPNTGIMRLLPREVFDSETYKKNNKTLTTRGGGAYYSFTKQSHDYNAGTDIELSHDQLSVGFAGLDYGMLTKVEGVNLRDLAAEYPPVASLIRYEPPTNEPAIRSEQLRFGRGTVIDGLSMKRNVPVELNATYLLRSISYSRADILVALQVVRKDSDGSVIIAWKLLKNFATPEVARTVAIQ
jgi:hypothetical protein